MIRAHQQRISDLMMWLSIIATLIIVGLLFIYSSSSVYAMERCGSSSYYVKKQLVGLFVGCCALIVARLTPLDVIHRFTPTLFFSSLALTALTLFKPLAQHIHGSSRWLKLAGFAFQPSELLKITLILYVAHFLQKKEFKLSSFTHGYLPLLFILATTCGVLLKQPDFGLAVTLSITVFALLFIAQFKNKHLLVTLAALIPAALALVYWRPYRWRRVLTFLNPWNDPQGAGFQVIQSLIAIGSGGVWGSGIAHSKQKFFYLPMQHTDFIFSIIAEETGFIGSTILITLFLLFMYLGYKLAWQLHDTFGTYTVLGFVTLIGLQALINIFVATGLLPTKGIGLPFVSYGNSSLVASLLMVGVIINMVYTQRRIA